MGVPGLLRYSCVCLRVHPRLRVLGCVCVCVCAVRVVVRVGHLICFVSDNKHSVKNEAFVKRFRACVGSRVLVKILPLL